MPKKSRVLGGRKAKRKGGRVERALVQFLKEFGIASARRTAQCNGKSEFSECDVVAPDDLPHFHIESKGTARPEIGEKLLTEWMAQLERDCKPGRYPVIFHKANQKPWMCLIGETVHALLQLDSPQLFFRYGVPFMPSSMVYFQGTVASKHLDTGTVYVILAKHFLEHMRAYEGKFATRDTDTRRRGATGNVLPCAGTSSSANGLSKNTEGEIKELTGGNDACSRLIARIKHADS